jgi:hypothetical protein
MENDKFDRETIDKYLVIAKKQYPDIDIHLLEYAISEYLLYDVEKRERPIEENEDFIKANKVIEELIAQREKINKELSDR